MKPNKKLVGKRIQAIRLEKGLTLKQFGEMLGKIKLKNEIEASSNVQNTVNKSNVLRWEQGISLPNKERLNKIAQLANITVNELLYGNNEYDIEDLEQRLLEIPIEERVELILRVFKETSKKHKRKKQLLKNNRLTNLLTYILTRKGEINNMTNKKDNINPTHYKAGNGELIDVIQTTVKDFGSVCQANMIKYALLD